MKDESLELARMVMEQNPPTSNKYIQAEKFWMKYAPSSVRGDRPISLTITYK